MDDELYEKMANLSVAIEELGHALRFVAKKLNQNDLIALGYYTTYSDIKKAFMSIKYYMEQISVLEELDDGRTIREWFFSTYGYNVPSDYSLWKAYKTLGVLGDD